MASASSPATEEIRRGSSAASQETSAPEMASACIPGALLPTRSPIEVAVWMRTGQDVHMPALNFSLSNYNPNAKNKTDATKRVTIRAAVGGALGGLAMIGGAVGVWLYLRRKKVKQEKEATAQDEISGPPETKQVLEMGDGSVGGQKGTAEADMKDSPTVVEIDSTVVFELGA
ncbi:hypothetical protein ACHAO4_000164 [Trichoderma viride]